jgi:hypothetical protein
MKMPSVMSCLGETREVTKTYGDGSHECPFCGYPLMPRCENPWCPADKPASTRPAFEEQARKLAERCAEEEARKRNREYAMLALVESWRQAAAERSTFIIKVHAAGGCLRCSDQYRDKVRRHRGECTKMRKL